MTDEELEFVNALRDEIETLKGLIELHIRDDRERIDRINYMSVEHARLRSALLDAGNEELEIMHSGNLAAQRWYVLARDRTREIERLKAEIANLQVRPALRRLLEEDGE